MQHWGFSIQAAKSKADDCRGVSMLPVDPDRSPTIGAVDCCALGIDQHPQSAEAAGHCIGQVTKTLLPRAGQFVILGPPVPGDAMQGIACNCAALESPC